MKIRIQTLVVVLLGCTTLAHAETVGMILDVAGDARLVQAGKESKADIAAGIDAGAKLMLGKSGQVSFVHYAGRSQYTASGPATLAVDAKGVQAVSGKAPQAKALPEQRASMAQGFQGRVVPAALVMKVAGMPPAPRLLTPAEGETILASAPTFVWEVAAGPSFRFELLQGEQVIHAGAAVGNELRLPSTLTLRRGETYRWRLTPTEDGRALPATASFTVASPELAQRLTALRPSPSAPAADWALYAMGLEQAKAVSEARQAWKRIAERRPDSAQAKELAH